MAKTLDEECNVVGGTLNQRLEGYKQKLADNYNFLTQVNAAKTPAELRQILNKHNLAGVSDIAMTKAAEFSFLTTKQMQERILHSPALYDPVSAHAAVVVPWYWPGKSQPSTFSELTQAINAETDLKKKAALQQYRTDIEGYKTAYETFINNPVMIDTRLRRLASEAQKINEYAAHDGWTANNNQNINRLHQWWDMAHELEDVIRQHGTDDQKVTMGSITDLATRKMGQASPVAGPPAIEASDMERIGDISFHALLNEAKELNDEVIAQGDKWTPVQRDERLAKIEARFTNLKKDQNFMGLVPASESRSIGLLGTYIQGLHNWAYGTGNSRPDGKPNHMTDEDLQALNYASKGDDIFIDLDTKLKKLSENAKQQGWTQANLKSLKDSIDRLNVLGKDYKKGLLTDNQEAAFVTIRLAEAQKLQDWASGKADAGPLDENSRFVIEALKSGTLPPEVDAQVHPPAPQPVANPATQGGGSGIAGGGTSNPNVPAPSAGTFDPNAEAQEQLASLTRRNPLQLASDAGDSVLGSVESMSPDFAKPFFRGLRELFGDASSGAGTAWKMGKVNPTAHRWWEWGGMGGGFLAGMMAGGAIANAIGLSKIPFAGSIISVICGLFGAVGGGNLMGWMLGKPTSVQQGNPDITPQIVPNAPEFDGNTSSLFQRHDGSAAATVPQIPSGVTPEESAALEAQTASSFTSQAVEGFDVADESLIANHPVSKVRQYASTLGRVAGDIFHAPAALLDRPSAGPVNFNQLALDNG